MKVTVVCPLFNKRQYIERTIFSVQKQTYKNWELIVVDDGSSDGSTELVSQIGNSDKRIKLILRQDITSKKGGNVCRNIGIENSTGGFIVFLDADDLLESYCLEQRIDYVKKYPNNSFYVFNVAYCKGDRNVPYSKFRPSIFNTIKFRLSLDKRNFFLKSFLSFDLPWHTSGPIWNKEFLLKIGGFNQDFQRLQDPEIHTRALLDKTVKVKYLMTQTKYDVLHRTDDDRIVWNKLEFLEKRLQSIDQYLTFFTPKVARYRISYLYKLQGYLLQAETLIYRSIRDEETAKYYEQNNLNISCNIDAIINRKYNIFLTLFRKSLQHSFLVKLKIPGMLLFFYKKILL